MLSLGKLVLSLFLALPVFSQTTPPPQTISVDKFCGMDNTNPANTIQDCNCQDCLNVESSVRGNSIKKRHGFNTIANLTISSSAVTGNLFYYDVNGNQNVIVCQDVNCELSQNTAAFTTLISTATPTPRYWSLVAQDGIAYGANDKQDKVWVYSNGTLTYSNTIPQCKLLDLTQDRMVCANTSANPNSVNYSKSGDVTIWAAGVNSVDPWSDNIGNPGQQITGLINWIGNEYIFTDQSITSCQLGDQYTTVCGIISNKLGTNDPQSVILTPSGVMFKGSDNNYWLYDGLSLINESLSISSLTVTAAQGKAFSNTQTTKADWQNGTQSPTGSWDFTTVPGSVRDSVTTFIDSTTASFNFATISTNIDTATVSNTIRLSSTTFFEKWTPTNLSGNYSWTQPGGAWSFISLGSCNGLGVNCIETSNTSGADLVNTDRTTQIALSTGDWKFTHFTSSLGCGTTQCFEFRFDYVDSTDYYAAFLNTTGVLSHTVGISFRNGGGITISSSTTINYNSNENHNWEIVRSPSGLITLYIDNVYQVSTTLTSISAGTLTEIAASGLNGTFTNAFTNISIYQYKNPGTFQSKIFDTTFSTTTWGQFSSTYTAVNQNNQGQVVFYTRVSTSPNNDLWDALVASSDTLKIASAAKRYIQYQDILTSIVSTFTPTVSAVQLQAATTGFFETQCINTTGMSATWGSLNCAESNKGAGLVNLFIASATTCGGIQNINGTWTAQTNNANVTISTNAAIGIRFQSLLGSATDQAQVDACTLNWVNGVLAPPVWGLYEPQNNSVYWSFSINQSTFNTRVLKYDMNLNSVYPFSINADSLLFFNNSLYFGGSNGGYWNQLGLVDNDAGQPINAYFKTKDFNCGSPFNEGLWQTFSMVAVNEPGGSINNTFTLDRGTTSTYSVAISTTSTIPYVRSNKNLPATSQATFANFNFGNNVADQPFEVVGYQIFCTPQLWRVLTP